MLSFQGDIASNGKPESNVSMRNYYTITPIKPCTIIFFVEVPYGGKIWRRENLAEGKFDESLKELLLANKI